MKRLAPVFLFLTCLFLLKTAAGQNTASQPGDPRLYQTILHMDSVMFDAFNTHNLEVLKTVFAPNVEFYHDRGGLQDYQTVMSGFKKIFASTPDLKRELIPGTLEVYPVPGFGAIETGKHRFVHTENGQILTGISEFSQIWQLKEGQWKVTRVISVGH